MRYTVTTREFNEALAAVYGERLAVAAWTLHEHLCKAMNKGRTNDGRPMDSDEAERWLRVFEAEFDGIPPKFDQAGAHSGARHDAPEPSIGSSFSSGVVRGVAANVPNSHPLPTGRLHQPNVASKNG